MLVRLAPAADSAHLARQAVTAVLDQLGRADLVDDATVVVSELVANAVMHARTELVVSVDPAGDGIRVSVADGSHILPRWSASSPTATSGRGLLLVQRLSRTWGVQPLADGGKVVWAQIDLPADSRTEDSFEDVLEAWADEPWPAHPLPETGVEIEVEIDVQAMLDSRAHTEELLRELQLILLNSSWQVTTGVSPPPIVQLAHRLASASDEFHEARRQIYNQTFSAAKHGNRQTTLHLLLRRVDAGAAHRWLDALDEADALTAAGVLLLPPFPPQMTDFRRAYISAIAEQLDASGGADATDDPPALERTP
jgi:anti-sigma regulatory factor (Ser/Thr protein kinase)